jgi:limonene-1,2-epoxide hydrolase
MVKCTWRGYSLAWDPSNFAAHPQSGSTLQSDKETAERGGTWFGIRPGRHPTCSWTRESGVRCTSGKALEQGEVSRVMNQTAKATNLGVVRRLCEEWSKLTRDEFHELLDPDCFYVNVPWSNRPNIGPDQAYDALSRYRNGWRVELHIIHVVAGDEVVLTERLERFQKLSDTTVHDLYVMGAFEMKNGKIAKWRDYFDSKHVEPFLG